MLKGQHYESYRYVLWCKALLETFKFLTIFLTFLKFSKNFYQIPWNAKEYLSYYLRPCDAGSIAELRVGIFGNETENRGFVNLLVDWPLRYTQILT